MTSSKNSKLRKTAYFDSKESAKVPKSPDLSAIIHRIGHDIGNPLTSIISLSSIIERFSDPSSGGAMDSEKLNRYSASILEEAWKISHLSESLVFLLTERPVNKSSCNLAEVISRAMQRLESRAPEVLKRVHVSIEIPENYVAIAEQDRLLYVFGELLRNAAYATLDIPDSPTIKIFAHIDNGQVNVIVENLTATSSPFQLEELFQPLVQNSTRTNSAGLGLPAVLNTVGLLGGTISLEEHDTEEGIYFRTILRFPQSEESNTEVETPIEEPEAESSLAQVRAVIIDDETTVSSAICKILEMGLAPTKVDCQCLNGEKAIALIESDAEFDIMFCDLNLNNMSGRHVYEHLLNERPQDKNKFVFITGDQGRHETIAYLDSVGRPYLLKPFEPQDLIDLVCELIE